MLKRLNIFVLSIFIFSLLSGVYADNKKEKGTQPDRPVVTTWSKIKELFE